MAVEDGVTAVENTENDVEATSRKAYPAMFTIATFSPNNLHKTLRGLKLWE